MNDAHVDLIVRVCEAFGRFALHKAAFISQEEGTKLELSPQAMEFLEWTTEQVLPTLMSESNGFPLQELDLSRISFVNESMVSMDTDVNLDMSATPGMMSPIGPPRKKGNRNSTPERFADGSFVASTKRKDSKVIQGDSTVLLLGNASFSLIYCACVLFSEWLIVGDGCGSASIVEAAMKWCSLFDAKNEEATENVQGSKASRKRLQVELMPAFARLAFALGKSAGSFELLQQLILLCYKIGEDDDNEIDNTERVASFIGGAVAAILKSPRMTEKAVAAVLDVGYKAIANQTSPTADTDASRCEADESLEMPVSMYNVVAIDDEGFGLGPTALAEALIAIMNHKQGCVFLAKKLVANIDFHAVAYSNSTNGEDANVTEGTVLRFEAKCLYLLANSAKNKCGVADALRKLSGVNLQSHPTSERIIQELLQEGQA